VPAGNKGYLLKSDGQFNSNGKHNNKSQSIQSFRTGKRKNNNGYLLVMHGIIRLYCPRQNN
jgi:hypothetical protein